MRRPGFPRRVPSLHTTLRPNEIGFTLPQIEAIKRSFDVLWPNLDMHSRKISVILFERQPHFLQLFHQTPPDNEGVHQFTTDTMRFLTDLVSRGMECVDLYRSLVADFVRHHLSLGLIGRDIFFIMEPYHEYFMEVLEKQMSPTLETALDKFFYNIVDAFEREHNRQRATTRLMNRLLH